MKSGTILTFLFCALASVAGAHTPQVGDSADTVLRELGTPIGTVGEEGGDQIFSYPTGMIGFEDGRVAWSDYVAPAEYAARERSEEARREGRARSLHSEAERVKKVYLSDPNLSLLSDGSIVEIWEGFRLRFPGEELPAAYEEAKSRLAEREAKEEQVREREEKERLERERAEAEYAYLDRWNSPVFYSDPIASVGAIISIQENALCELRASRSAAFRAHNAAEVRRLDGLICDTKSYIQGIRVRIGWAPFPPPIKPCPPSPCGFGVPSPPVACK